MAYSVTAKYEAWIVGGSLAKGRPPRWLQHSICCVGQSAPACTDCNGRRRKRIWRRENMGRDWQLGEKQDGSPPHSHRMRPGVEGLHVHIRLGCNDYPLEHAVTFHPSSLGEPLSSTTTSLHATDTLAPGKCPWESPPGLGPAFSALWLHMPQPWLTTVANHDRSHHRPTYIHSRLPPSVTIWPEGYG
jgi:hypothetical protein